ncbi:hypothetical protein AVEN_30594-1 [Araneus ventricosus]|uniref:Uncharacterized protein n=1 Tax=Araneus ventricosus TaxID=182803 RepID=A0A4Y2EQH6_ARAVE|nr:hypothetical protein AVEN_30594-1 [Araneus ventricosus]
MKTRCREKLLGQVNSIGPSAYVKSGTFRELRPGDETLHDLWKLNMTVESIRGPGDLEIVLDCYQDTKENFDARFHEDHFVYVVQAKHPLLEAVCRCHSYQMTIVHPEIANMKFQNLTFI